MPVEIAPDKWTEHPVTSAKRDRQHELVVRAGALNDYHAGENITIHFDMTKCHFFDAETEIAIR